MALSIYDWSSTAAANASADSGINWAEGQAPGTVNGSARGEMAAHARFLKDNNGTLNTTGSNGIFAATSNVEIASLVTGLKVRVKTNHTCSASPTFNLTPSGGAALGAKAIKWFNAFAGEASVLAGQMYSGGHYALQYDASANAGGGSWILLNPAIGPTKGTETSDSASSGYVGELLSSSRPVASVLALVNSLNVSTTLTNITLTPGDWDVDGVIYYSATDGTVTVGTVLASLGTSSNTPNTTVGEYNQQHYAVATSGSNPVSLPVPTQRKSLNASTTIYLTAAATFTNEQLGAFGAIRARRVR